MRRVDYGIFASAAALAAATPASAQVTIAPINGPNLDTAIKASKTITENNTNVVFGSTENGNSADVKFTGNTAINITDGAGFASISDANRTPDFRVLTIELTKAFTDLQFSLQLNDDGRVLIEYALFGSNNFLPAGGTNPFTQNGNQLRDYQLTSNPDVAMGALRITSCSLAGVCTAGVGSGTGINFEKQNSVTLVGSAVPEPGTWAMMLIGFGAIGASMRRRRARHLPQFA
jgi:hypothetical protein